MSVVRTDKSPIEAELAVVIARDDYEPKLKEELKKYQQKAHMKGFRKGKVPMSVIRKMYGRSMLADVINDMVQKQLGGYIQEEKLDILGQPLPSEDQQSYDFLLSELEDFEFKFDVALSPELEVVGVDDGTTYEQNLVEVSDKMIDDDLEAARKRSGKEVHPESGVEEEDSITFEAIELEGDEVKKKGFETTFKILVSQIDNQEVKDKVIGGKVGDKIRFDIFELEKDRTDDYVRKYLLNITDEEEDLVVGRWYEGRIKEITRIEPADLDQEFFDKAFPEQGITTEEEARGKIKEHIEKFYERQSEALLFKDFQDKLQVLNEVDLPDAFLKRWLLASNEELSQEQLDKEYPIFSRNLLWTLIERSIKNKYELKVEIEEVKEVLKAQLMQYMGGYQMQDAMLDEYVERMLGNQEQFNKAYEEKMSDKVFEAIKEHVNIEEKRVSLEEFQDLIKAAEADRNSSGLDEEE